jgi:hypothetical protein
MITEEPSTVAIVIPLNNIDALAYRWHRSDWIMRALLLGLGISAAKEVQFVGDMLEQWTELLQLRQHSRGKAINDRWRALERDAFNRFGNKVTIHVREPFLETTACCGKVVARQVMDGDVWGVAVD